MRKLVIDFQGFLTRNNRFYQHINKQQTYKLYYFFYLKITKLKTYKQLKVSLYILEISLSKGKDSLSDCTML